MNITICLGGGWKEGDGPVKPDHDEAGVNQRFLLFFCPSFTQLRKALYYKTKNSAVNCIFSPQDVDPYQDGEEFFEAYCLFENGSQKRTLTVMLWESMSWGAEIVCGFYCNTRMDQGWEGGRR